MKLPHIWTRVTIVAVGVGLGPLVQLLATPLLARMYSPADFGQLALFASVVSVLTVVACLRYEGAIQVGEDSEVDSIVWASVAAALLIFVVGMVALLLGAPQDTFESLHNLYEDARWVPVVAACAGVIAVASNLTLRTNRYVRNALLRSGASVVFVAIALGSSGITLLHANAMAFTCMGLVAVVYLWRSVQKVRLANVWQVAQIYKKYPLLLAPTSLLDAVALTLPVMFISGSYGLDATGHYAQIQRLIGAPVLLAGVIAGQLFTKRSGELYRAGESSRALLWKVTGTLAVGAAVAILAIALFGEPLCQLILGGAWRVDTQFLLLVTIPLFVRAIVSPVTTVFLTHNHIEVAVKWQIGYFAVTFGGLKYAASTMTFERFLMAYACIEMVAYLTYLALCHWVAAVRKNAP